MNIDSKIKEIIIRNHDSDGMCEISIDDFVKELSQLFKEELEKAYMEIIEYILANATAEKGDIIFSRFSKKDLEAIKNK